MSYYNNMGYYQQMQYPNPQFIPQTQQAPQGLNGKIVDTVDMVKVTEVPLGGYGIFPKADLSEIYIKTWNQNGTTNIITFKPTSETEEKQKEETLNTIVNKIQELDNKLDMMMSKSKGDVRLEYEY